MFGEALAALEALAPVADLRASVWAYPLVNAGHVLGVALLVGAVVPLDLRLLGAWPDVPVEPLMRTAGVTAAAGLAAAVVFGALLFATRATEYAASTLFLVKMAVVAAGAANALALRLAWRRPGPAGARAGAGPIPAGVRVAAAVSLCGWIGALVLGRLVGYF